MYKVSFPPKGRRRKKGREERGEGNGMEGEGNQISGKATLYTPA